MKDTANGGFLLTRQAYWEFIGFWQENYSHLAEAVLAVTQQCPDVRIDPETLAMPVVDLGKLRRFLERAVGKKAMDRLLIHREEAAAGGKLYREAAGKLWEIADALPPHDLGPVTETTNSSPVYARFWLKSEGEATQASKAKATRKGAGTPADEQALAKG